MLDIHCHVLSSVDDGSVSAAMTRQMLRIAKQEGIDRIIATPHVTSEATDLSAIRSAFAEACLGAEPIKMDLRLGFEVNYRLIAQMADDLTALERFCVSGTNVLLIELSRTAIFPNWEYVLSHLSSRFVPVIAHPERLPYVQSDHGILAEMKSYGCEVQLDAEGIAAGPLSSEGRAARRLMSMGLVDYVASDAHRPEDYRAFASAKKKLGADWPKSGTLHRIAQWQ